METEVIVGICVLKLMMTAVTKMMARLYIGNCASNVEDDDGKQIGKGEGTVDDKT